MKTTQYSETSNSAFGQLLSAIAEADAANAQFERTAAKARRLAKQLKKLGK